MLPLLLHKLLDSLEGISLEDDIQDFALDEQFEVNEGVDLVAHLLTCLNHRVNIFVGTNVIFLVGLVLDVTHCINTYLNLHRCFL